MTQAEEPTIYAQIGGGKTFERLANAFYDRIQTDTFLRPMFPGSLHCARKHLALFLAQFFGGPSGYDALRGSPRLRIRHLPFKIGQEERDHWLTHMLAAMEEIGVPEPARSVMADYFTSASTYLINQPAQADPVPIVMSPDRQTATMQTRLETEWNHLVALDQILDALRAADPQLFARLMEEPDTRQYLATNRVAYRDILAQAFETTDPTILHEARRRLAQEPDLVHVFGNYGFTLLHEAAGAWNNVLIEFLLSLGALPDAQDNGSHPPLYFAANRYVSRALLSQDEYEGAHVVRRLLKHGANPNSISGSKRVTPLHMAARRGHVQVAVTLIEHGANLEARDSNGETPLRRAVNCGHPQLVSVLLAHGADARTQDNRGVTPLEVARNPEIRARLLRAT